VGFVCVALLLCCVRAPWETRWIGWRGGWDMRRRDLGRAAKNSVELPVERELRDVGSDKEVPATEEEDGVRTSGKSTPHITTPR